MKQQLQKTPLRIAPLAILGLLLTGFSLQAQTPVTLVGFNYTTTRQYNGTRNLSIANVGYVTGVAAGDNVGVSAVGLYADSLVGEGIPYSVTFTLTGPQAANYILDTVISGTDGVITPRPLGVSGTQIQSSKVYTGGNYCPTISAGTLSNRIPGDVVTLNASANYVDPNVGTGKDVVVVFTLTGAAAPNYLPPDSITLTADITPKPIHITGTVIDSTKVYDGTTVAPVIIHGLPNSSDLVSGDNVMPITATAQYLTPNVGSGKQVVASYNLRGPQAANYLPLDDSTLRASITPRPLSFSGTHVRLCKEYDGNDDAIVLYGGFATNLVEGDSIDFVTHAYYDSPDAGHNKTISVSYSYPDGFFGFANYSFPAPEVYSTEGKIIMPTILTDMNDDGDKFDVDDQGVCQSTNAPICFSLQQGEPCLYTILFSEEALNQGFVNIIGGAINTNIGYDTIYFAVPENAAHGTYWFDIFLTNEAEVSTDTVRVSFTVNYPNSYITAIFEDVISIVNTDEMFNTYQWYRNGEELSGATKPYYQELGGLNGSYYVELDRGTATQGHTCPLFFTPSAEGIKTLTVTPNPIQSSASLSLTGFDNNTHILNIYNAFGQRVLSLTFEGTDYSIDLSAIPQGVYIIDVDGVNIKTIKN